jgi:hypothetical protein
LLYYGLGGCYLFGLGQAVLVVYGVGGGCGLAVCAFYYAQDSLKFALDLL